jgi:hypothetical protein
MKIEFVSFTEDGKGNARIETRITIPGLAQLFRYVIVARLVFMLKLKGR